MIIKRNLIVTALGISLSCSSMVYSSTALDDAEKSFAEAKAQLFQKNMTVFPDKTDVLMQNQTGEEQRQQSIKMYQNRLKQLQERDKKVTAFLKTLSACQKEIENEMLRLGAEFNTEESQALPSRGRDPYLLRSAKPENPSPIRKNRRAKLETKKALRKK